jgi:hypothetical protein
MTTFSVGNCRAERIVARRLFDRRCIIGIDSRSAQRLRDPACAITAPAERRASRHRERGIVNVTKCCTTLDYGFDSGRNILPVIALPSTDHHLAIEILRKFCTGGGVTADIG